MLLSRLTHPLTKTNRMQLQLALVVGGKMLVLDRDSWWPVPSCLFSSCTRPRKCVRRSGSWSCWILSSRSTPFLQNWKGTVCEILPAVMDVLWRTVREGTPRPAAHRSEGKKHYRKKINYSQTDVFPLQELKKPILLGFANCNLTVMSLETHYPKLAFLWTTWWCYSLWKIGC